MNRNIIATLNGDKFYSHLIRDLNLIVTERNDKIYINLSNMVNFIKNNKDGFRELIRSRYFKDYLMFYINLHNLDLNQTLNFNSVTDLVELLPELFFMVKTNIPEIKDCYGPIDLVDFILFKIKPEYSYQVHNLLQEIQNKVNLNNQSFTETLSDQIDSLKEENLHLKLKIGKLKETLRIKEEEINNNYNFIMELQDKIEGRSKIKIQGKLTNEIIQDLRRTYNIVSNINVVKTPTPLDITHMTSILTLYVSNEDLNFSQNNIRLYYKIEPISELTDTLINHTTLLTFESSFKISSIFNFESNTIINHDKNNSFLINRDNLTKFLIELKVI